MTETNELERKLRRDRDTLVIVGLGVTAFGVWSAVKTAMLFLFQIPELRAEFGEEGSATLGVVVTGIMMLLILVFDIRLRLFILRSARAEGLRGERKMGYLYAAGILAAFSLISIVISACMLAGVRPAIAGNELNSDSEDYLTSLIIELTSLVTLVEMIAASVRVKRAARRLEQRQG